MRSALKTFYKDYSKLHLGVKLVVLLMFVRSFGWGIVDPYWSLYLDQFNDNYTAVGLLTGLFSFTALFAIIPLMKVADKVDEAKVIRDGQHFYFFVIFAYVLAGLLLSLPLLIFALILNGLAHTLTVVGAEAYIRKHDGKGLSGPFGFYITADYLGWVLGMIIASFIFQYIGLNSMFLFILPSVLIAYLILPHIHERGLKSLLSGFRKYIHGGHDLSVLIDDWKQLNPKMLFFLLLAFFDGAIRMFTLVFIPLFGLSIGLELGQIALLMAAMYFPFTLSYFFAEMEDHMSKMRVIASGLFIGAIALLLLYFIVHEVWVMIIAAFISLSMAIIRPAYNGCITRLTPRAMMGEVTGLNNFVERLGRIIGPILIGMVADRFGLSVSFLLIGLIALSLGAASLVLRGYDLLVSETADNCKV